MDSSKNAENNQDAAKRRRTYLELLLYEPYLNLLEIQKTAFKALDNEIKSVVFTESTFDAILRINSGEFFDASILIDFPYGVNDHTIKNHEITRASRHGAQKVDVVLNTNHIINNRWSNLERDVVACRNACVERRLEFRCILEYGFLDVPKCVETANILSQCGVQTLILGTGVMIEDLSDLIILAKEIQDTDSLSVVITTNAWQPIQFDSIIKADIFGIRFKSIEPLKKFLVYSKAGIPSL